MPSTTHVSSLDHAGQVAQAWINEVASEFDTDDREFCYRVLRAWLHTLRDRLTVEAAARFAAGLPELIRGVFYSGWDPSWVPMKYDSRHYAGRFAHEANISVRDADKSLKVVTAVLLRMLDEGQVRHVLDELPREIRTLLSPSPFG